MEVKDLKELIKLFSDSNVDQLSLEQEGFSLQLGKEKTVVTTVAAEAPVVTAAVQSAPAPAAPAQDEDEGLFIVTSPIVGTYYAAPNPGADPFVAIGDRVRVGQTLCIVEAMKLMNEIISDEAGEVVKIYVENGEGVEFGQKLMGVKVG
ncbi:acetyl-CoA carboxylase biotin carboxyl carrier protein [Acanthopleuribacter pedis]|uniref:Biotin carboxyl carrier protein of acetyl-CoA carboxylase n=1 Tax=Acanthopleuribacter pedis TaxID=442870 RepID=A0A8J7U3V5_9BACT|nr:acetyl-CoA carboxylase biotin carboxyl carrier protein [Acanthopleuribacter pedis]MBO1319997.1 acetyl-CoA carboxylase biotin carboxyl carrier protein [Acanthopleuribacter pedis]